MTPPSILLTLQQHPFHQKKILSALKKCLKKLSFKSSADLWNLDALARWLYVYGYDDLALQTCQIIDAVDFRGDFNLWTPIESLLLLEARLYRERGDESMVQPILTKILAPMLPHEEAFRRRLSFNWLSDAALARYLEKNDHKTANQIRFSDLGDLFFIRELGEGKTDIDDIPVDIVQAEARILESIQIIKQT